VWRESLEKMGAPQVRSNLERDKIQPAYVHLTSQWLAEKDREADAREQASRLEQTEIARSAAAEAARASDAAERAATAAERQAMAAERANTRATIALVIAIISITVSAIGIWLPLWEVHK
jgi:CHASE3 domain sensor protein